VEDLPRAPHDASLLPFPTGTTSKSLMTSMPLVRAAVLWSSFRSPLSGTERTRSPLRRSGFTADSLDSEPYQTGAVPETRESQITQTWSQVCVTLRWRGESRYARGTRSHRIACCQRFVQTFFGAGARRWQKIRTCLRGTIRRLRCLSSHRGGLTVIPTRRPYRQNSAVLAHRGRSTQG